jgi:hypothetical protein
MPQTTGNSEVTGQPPPPQRWYAIGENEKRTKKVTEYTQPFHTESAQWSNPEAEMKKGLKHRHNRISVSIKIIILK